MYEIIIGCTDGSLYVLNSDGKTKWTFDTRIQLEEGGGIFTSPLVNDIDQDGVNEIIFGTGNDNIVCIDENGILEWTLSIKENAVPSGIMSTPMLIDLNNDDILEIIIGSNYRYLYAITLEKIEQEEDRKPRILWKFETGSNEMAILAAPVAADIDNDEKPEILFGARDSFFYCLNSDGSLKWKFDTGGPIYVSCSVGDVNQDGYIDIIFGSYDRNIYLLNNNGTLINTIPTFDVVTNQIIICNLNGDSSIELVVPTVLKNDTPTINIVNYQGELITAIPYGPIGNLTQRRVMNLVVCDLENDNVIEIVFGTEDGKLVILRDETNSGTPDEEVGTDDEFPCNILILIIITIILLVGLYLYKYHFSVP